MTTSFRGLSFDIQSRKISFLGRNYSFGDIIDFSFVDNSYIKKIGGGAVSKTNTGNAIGRALVGGLLFGEVGALVGGMTASNEITYNPATELKVEKYAIQITVNDFAHPLICLDFGGDFATANLVASYLKIIIFRNSPQNSRYNIFKKLHDLKLYFSEGLMTEEEYNREVGLIKNNEINAIQEDTQRIQFEIDEANRKVEEERIKLEAEDKKKEAIRNFMEGKELQENEIGSLMSANKSLYGFNVGDVIILKESGKISNILAFTEDKKVVSKLDDEYQIFNFGDFRLV